jgi:hypothetical protein
MTTHPAEVPAIAPHAERRNSSSSRFYAVVLTPQKNGTGPLVIPAIVRRDA